MMRWIRLHGLGVAMLLSCAVIVTCASLDWKGTWQRLGVQSAWPPFFDLQSITGATVTLSRGLDPLVDNVGDPLHRPANYPRIWFRVFALLGWGPSATVPLGVCFAGLFAAGGFALQPIVRRRSDAVLMFVAAMSPAALLGVERGNIDLVVFPLLCLAAVQPNRPWRSAGLLGAAAVLKIYPVFGLAGLVRGRRGVAAACTTSAALAALGWIYIDDLRLISSIVPVAPLGSFGVRSHAAFLASGTHFPVSHAASLAIVLTLALGAMAIGAALAWTPPPETMPEPVPQAFLIGAAIYVGCFLASPNFDYRLICLIPTIPCLNAFRRSSSRITRGIGVAGLAAIGLAMFEAVGIRLLGIRGALPFVGGKFLLLLVLTYGGIILLRGTPCSTES